MKTRVKENKFIESVKLFFGGLVATDENVQSSTMISAKEIEKQEPNKAYIKELEQKTGKANIPLDKDFVPHADISEKEALRKAEENIKAKKKDEKIREN